MIAPVDSFAVVLCRSDGKGDFNGAAVDLAGDIESCLGEDAEHCDVL